MRPVTYNVDLIKLNQFLNTENRDETSALENNASLEKISETDEAWIKTGIDEKEKVIRTGFVAQEVEVAAKKLGYDFSGVDKPQNKYSLYGLRYAEFVVPLVKAVQELSKMNDDKEAKINAQQKINENLQKQINELKAMINANIKVQPDLASIEQNKPNPFSNSSSISYFIPAGAKNARLNITDNAGKIIKQITLNAKTGIVNINAHALSNGTYYYTLLVDGKLIETKKMIVTH